MEALKKDDPNKLQAFLEGLNESQRLVIFKQSPNLQDSPLHLTVTKKSYKSLALLLKYGAAVNQTDKLGWTPLHLAASLGDLQSVKLLVRQNADTNALIHGINPCCLAIKHDNRIELFTVLIQPDTNVDALLNIAIEKEDFITILLALLQTKNFKLSSSSLDSIFRKRELFWNKMETFLELPSNGALKRKFYNGILDKNHPLETIFNDNSNLSFWKNKYTETAKKYLPSYSDSNTPLKEALEYGISYKTFS